jgi:HEAT repeat protein
MIDNGGLLETVIDHASQLDDVAYDDIAPTVAALTGSGDVSLVPRLSEALDRFLDEENFYGRDLIAGVLAGVAGITALPALLLAADRDLGDDQDSLQAEIAALLGADPVAGREWIHELARSDAPERRRAGLLALGSVAEAGDVGLLEEAAGHPDPDVRLTAVDAVVDPAGDDRAFAVLVAASEDLDEQVRMAAISRLAASGRLEAAAALTKVITDSRYRVRARTAYALGLLGSTTATPALLQLLRDEDGRVRDQARDALGVIGGPAAVDDLLAEAIGEDARLRAQAAKALAKAVDSDSRVEPQLMLLAKDYDPTVRAATLSGLASVANRSARWSVLATTLADDPDATVRQRVAVVAHHLAPDDFATILHRLADDIEATVRQAAATELRRRPS